MDLNQSYLQRLVDLGKPLMAKAEVAQSVPQPMPLNLEEDVEVEALNPAESIQSPPLPSLSTEHPSFKEETNKSPEAPSIVKTSPEIVSVLPPAKAPLLQEEPGEKSLFSEKPSVETFQKQVFSQAEPLKKDLFEREPEASEKTAREFPAIEELWNEVLNPRESTSQTLNEEKFHETPVREFFTHSHETQEKITEHFEKHFHEKEKVMVFTPEQKQTIHQYIQVAVRAFEKKAAETTARIETPVVPQVKTPSWRGWSATTRLRTR